MSDPAYALLLGQTGAGKSTVGQTLAEHLGYRGVAFEASDSIDAHTQKPKSVVVGGIKITDGPGLMDTEGREKDIKNIELIVNAAKESPCLNAAILVLSEANDRFDSAVQGERCLFSPHCLKLLIDSFGPDIVARIAVVFTRAGGKTPEQAKLRATAMAGVLRRLTGVPVETFPVFQIDAGVRSDARFAPAYVAERVEKNARELDGLAMWVRTQPAISTVDFKIGEYAEAKRLREAQEREAAERKRADDEAAARRDAEQRARDAEQRARDAERAQRDNRTFLDGRGFVIGGTRIW